MAHHNKLFSVLCQGRASANRYILRARACHKSHVVAFFAWCRHRKENIFPAAWGGRERERVTHHRLCVLCRASEFALARWLMPCVVSLGAWARDGVVYVYTRTLLLYSKLRVFLNASCMRLNTCVNSRLSLRFFAAAFGGFVYRNSGFVDWNEISGKYNSVAVLVNNNVLKIQRRVENSKWKCKIFICNICEYSFCVRCKNS